MKRSGPLFKLGIACLIGALSATTLPSKATQTKKKHALKSTTTNAPAPTLCIHLQDIAGPDADFRTPQLGGELVKYLSDRRLGVRPIVLEEGDRAVCNYLLTIEGGEWDWQLRFKMESVGPAGRKVLDHGTLRISSNTSRQSLFRDVERQAGDMVQALKLNKP